ncbi:hypothetical protein KI387_041990, partial [Taxus chinensis]
MQRLPEEQRQFFTDLFLADPVSSSPNTLAGAVSPQNAPLKIFNDPLPNHDSNRLNPTGTNKGAVTGNNDHEASTSLNPSVAPQLGAQPRPKIVSLVELDAELPIEAITRTREYFSQPSPSHLPETDKSQQIVEKPIGAYDLISDLTKTFSHISFLDLLKNSPPHRAALLEALGLGHLINITPPPETQVNHVDFDIHPPGQPDKDVEFIFEISKMPTDAEIARR